MASIQARLTRAERLAKLRAPLQPPILRQLRQDPARIMALAGLYPDPWQAGLLRSSHPETLILAGRQVGKSKVASALALREALLSPPALVLILSPTLRQSGELFRDKLLPIWRALGSPCRGRPPTRLELELANGSRVVSLPEAEEGIRGFSSVRLLVLDEASRIDDDLYRAVRPMLAVSRGSVIALSTPFGRRGWFWESWAGVEPWHRVAVPAADCPRFDATFLARERMRLGDRWADQEYNLTFLDAVDQLFSQSLIEQSMVCDAAPLFAS